MSKPFPLSWGNQAWYLLQGAAQDRGNACISHGATPAPTDCFHASISLCESPHHDLPAVTDVWEGSEFEPTLAFLTADVERLWKSDGTDRRKVGSVCQHHPHSSCVNTKRLILLAFSSPVLCLFPCLVAYFFNYHNFREKRLKTNMRLLVNENQPLGGRIANCIFNWFLSGLSHQLRKETHGTKRSLFIKYVGVYESILLSALHYEALCVATSLKGVELLAAHLCPSVDTLRKYLKYQCCWRWLWKHQGKFWQRFNYNGSSGCCCVNSSWWCSHCHLLMPQNCDMAHPLWRN